MCAKENAKDQQDRVHEEDYRYPGPKPQTRETGICMVSDMVEAAARHLNVPLARCLYVGDTEVDIDTAKNADIDCACVTWGFRTREHLKQAGASIIVDTPEELAAYIFRNQE